MVRKIIVAVLLLGLLTGCMAKFSYGFADWVIEWMITDYVSLDKTQKKQLKLTIDKQLAWHKETQLPRYRDWLIEFRVQTETGLNRQWLIAWSEQLTVFWQDLALQINPDTIAFLRSLSDAQVEELIAKLDESQLELAEEYMDPDEDKRLAERAERTEDFTSELLGKLNQQQKGLIGQWNANSGDSTKLWMENREQWTRRFELALQGRSGDQFADEITLLFVYQEQLWSEQYQQSIERNFNSGINLVLAIEPTVSDKQRKKLYKLLDKWIAVLDDLSK
jgi:hypothetical protein